MGREADETIGVLRRAVARARLGEGERLAAIRRLDEQARRIDAAADTMTPDEFDHAVAAERASKAALGGRTVADDRSSRTSRTLPTPRPRARSGAQLQLPWAPPVHRG